MIVFSILVHMHQPFQKTPLDLCKVEKWVAEEKFQKLTNNRMFVFVYYCESQLRDVPPPVLTKVEATTPNF